MDPALSLVQSLDEKAQTLGSVVVRSLSMAQPVSFIQRAKSLPRQDFNCFQGPRGVHSGDGTVKTGLDGGTAMVCPRCDGLMLQEVFVDFVGSEGSFEGWRCLVCGEIVDPVIVNNRVLHMSGALGQALHGAGEPMSRTAQRVGYQPRLFLLSTQGHVVGGGGSDLAGEPS